MEGNRKLSTEQALKSWRAAGREVDHRKQMLTTVESASVAAEQAERSAQDTADATQAVVEAAAKAGATATAAAEAATITRQQVDFHRADAHAKLAAAMADEDVARELYHHVQDRVFERYGKRTDADREPEASGAG
jgi:hypothetical protein